MAAATQLDTLSVSDNVAATELQPAKRRRVTAAGLPEQPSMSNGG